MQELKNFSKHFTEYTELRVQKNTSARVAAFNGDFVQNTKTGNQGASARAYKDGVWGFASSPTITNEEVTSLIGLATDNAKVLAQAAPINAKPFATGVTGTGRNGKKETSKDASQKQMIEFTREIDEYIKTKYPEIVSRTVSLRLGDTERNIVTADGADLYTYVARSNLSIVLAVNASDGPVELYDVFGGLGQFADNFKKPSDYFANIDTMVENLKQKAEGVYAKPGMHDVVLGSNLAGILAHEAIGHTVEADMVLGGSVAAHLMGQQVASPLVTLVDFAYEYNGKLCPVPIWIDDEGTKAKDAVLIKEGILNTYMHNKATAAHFGVSPTGNARANEFYDEPLVRMRNTAILPGTSKLADMISSIDDGYYLVRSSNGQADTTSEFMFGVIVGYEIKNGKLGKALRDCTVSGVAFDMLKTVSMISDDMSWSNAGWCGKKQLINVGMGGPAIKCKIGIGGRA